MAEGAATAGQGRGRQGGDPPVARQLHSWQGGLYKQTCVVGNKKTCVDCIWSGHRAGQEAVLAAAECALEC